MRHLLLQMVYLFLILFCHELDLSLFLFMNDPCDDSLIPGRLLLYYPPLPLNLLCHLLLLALERVPLPRDPSQLALQPLMLVEQLVILEKLLTEPALQLSNHRRHRHSQLLLLLLG